MYGKRHETGTRRERKGSTPWYAAIEEANCQRIEAEWAQRGEEEAFNAQWQQLEEETATLQRQREEAAAGWALAWDQAHGLAPHEPYQEAYADWQDAHPDDPATYAEWDARYTPGDRD